MVPPVQGIHPDNRVKTMMRIAVLSCTLVVVLALFAHRYPLTTVPSRDGSPEEPPEHGIRRFWEGETPGGRLFFLQETEGRDGPACVQMVLAYWKYYPDQHDLKTEMRTQDNGTSPEFMDDPFKDRGLTVESGGRTRQFSESASRLRQEIDRNRPIIISIETDEKDRFYYVVVVGYYDKGIIINNPTRENGEHLRWDYGDLNRIWSPNRYWMLIAYT